MSMCMRRWGALGATMALAASITLPLVGCSLPGIPGLPEAPAATVAEARYTTADALAADFGKQFDDMLANPTDDQTREMAEFILDNFAPGVEEALMEEKNLSSRDEALDLLVDEFGDMSEAFATLEEFKDLMEMKVDLVPGAALSGSSIDAMNSDFEDEGLDTQVTEGNYLEATLTCTLLEDVGDTAKGESMSEDIPMDSIVLVKVDNGWYLWVE